jgi:hypothetical protein
MIARVCSCGHRLGIHEYPARCNGAVSWPDDNVTRCECWHSFTWEEIKPDRDLLESEAPS